MQPVLKAQAQSALFNEANATDVLPKLQVVFMWSTRTPWHCAWAFIETEKQLKQHVSQGHKVRPIRFIEIEGTNHFVRFYLVLSEFIPFDYQPMTL
jgi:hypothetical protein